MIERQQSQEKNNIQTDRPTDRQIHIYQIENEKKYSYHSKMNNGTKKKKQNRKFIMLWICWVKNFECDSYNERNSIYWKFSSVQFNVLCANCKCFHFTNSLFFFEQIDFVHLIFAITHGTHTYTHKQTNCVCWRLSLRLRWINEKANKKR